MYISEVRSVGSCILEARFGGAGHAHLRKRVPSIPTWHVCGRSVWPNHTEKRAVHFENKSEKTEMKTEIKVKTQVIENRASKRCHPPCHAHAAPRHKNAQPPLSLTERLIAGNAGRPTGRGARRRG